MKKHLSAMSRLPLLLVCVALVSCKETKLMQAQLAELNVKIQAVQAEMVQMENQMADYRKQMPTAMSGGQVAKQQAAVLAAGLAAVETEIAQTQAAIKDTESAIEAAKKDLETLRTKDPR